LSFLPLPEPSCLCENRTIPSASRDVPVKIMRKPSDLA
jgi:hypothetical protein